MNSKPVNSATRPNRQDAVLRVNDLPPANLASLLKRYGLNQVHVGLNQTITGSYWGDEEAGLLGSTLYARADTPIHSVLHEACHYVCMDETRRHRLDTNAQGDYDEENAVCFLQILLADELAGMGRARMWQDMDAWGYSFRLGSAESWFNNDAEDARQWLLSHQLISQQGVPTWLLRTT